MRDKAHFAEQGSLYGNFHRLVIAHTNIITKHNACCFHDDGYVKSLKSFPLFLG